MLRFAHLAARLLRRLATRSTLQSVLACVVLLTAGAAHASVALPPGVTAGPQLEGVHEYRLANGLTVILAPDTSRPLVTVHMTYRVGARHEPHGQTGMAHLLEHMLFRGTPTLRDALAEFSRRGLSANGTTNNDRTNYYATFATDRDNLYWFLRWQADTMVNALIDANDLAAEMPVVMNELNQAENDGFYLLLRRLQATAYEWHGYGRGVLGARSDLEALDIANLRAFYEAHYQPDNAVLIITGDFDLHDTLAVAADAFGAIPAPSRTLAAETTIEPVQDGERTVMVRRPGGSPMVAALFHSAPAGGAEQQALAVAMAMLADVPAGRLYQRLVSTGLAAGVFAFESDSVQPGYAVAGAALEPGMDPDRALAALHEAIASIADTPFTQAELDRFRTRWETAWRDTRDHSARLAHALAEAAVIGDWRLFFYERELIDSLSLEDIQRVAQAYLVPSNRTSGQFLPTESPIQAPSPAPVDLSTPLATYTGRAESSAVDAFEATAASIQAATQRQSLDLPNGSVQMALLPKPTRGDRVEAALLIQFGDAQTLQGQSTAAAAAAALLHHGTAAIDRQALSDRVDALQSGLSFHGGAGSILVRLSSRREHLDDLLTLAIDVLRQAQYPDDAVQEFQRQRSTQLEQARTDPASLAHLALARHDNPWPADDPRYVPTFDEALQRNAALTADAIRQFHARFYGAGHISFVAVGDFDPDTVQDTLTAGLAGWQRAPDYQRLTDPYPKQWTPARFELATPGKTNGYFLAALPLRLQDNDPDMTPLLLANDLLGGGPDSLLWQRARVKEGISYNIDSTLQASAYEPSGHWSLSALFTPRDGARLQTAIHEVLAAALKDGFTAADVQTAIDAILRQRRLGYANDGALVSAWLRHLQTGRDFTWTQQQEALLQAQTADTVTAALRRWIDPAELAVAIAADPAATHEEHFSNPQE